MSQVKTVDKVIWCNRLSFPYYYGFCPSEKAWKREMKRLDIAGGSYSDAEKKHSAWAVQLTSAKNYSATLVCLGEKPKSILWLYGTLAHEAVHVFQHIMERIGETRPSDELQAYSIEWITRHLMLAAHKTIEMPKVLVPPMWAKGRSTNWDNTP